MSGSLPLESVVPKFVGAHQDLVFPALPPMPDIRRRRRPSMRRTGSSCCAREQVTRSGWAPPRRLQAPFPRDVVVVWGRVSSTFLAKLALCRILYLFCLPVFGSDASCKTRHIRSHSAQRNAGFLPPPNISSRRGGTPLRVLFRLYRTNHAELAGVLGHRYRRPPRQVRARVRVRGGAKLDPGLKAPGFKSSTQ